MVKGRRRSPILLGWGVAILVLAADQISKWWILAEVMRPPRVIEVAPFFNLVLTWNRGVSFGLFNSDSSSAAWILIAVALVISAILAVWLHRETRPIIVVSLGSIIGGALGNVIDRLRFGAVTDFLDLHLWGYHWPAFNVADAGISVGAVTLILHSLLEAPEQRKNESVEREGNK